MELSVSNARYFDFYDLAPVGYITVSEQGLILEANLTAATLLGATRGTLTTQPISRFLLKEDQDSYYRQRKQAGEPGAPQALDLRMVRTDGTSFWAHLKATPAAEPAGARRIVLSEITRRKQAEAEKAALAANLHRSEALRRVILDSLCAHVAVINATGDILAVNEPWRRFAMENAVQEISSVIWAMAQLRAEPIPSWLAAAEMAAAPRLGRCDQQQLALIVWGLGRLGHEPGRAFAARAVLATSSAARRLTPSGLPSPHTCGGSIPLCRSSIMSHTA